MFYVYKCDLNYKWLDLKSQGQRAIGGNHAMEISAMLTCRSSGLCFQLCLQRHWELLRVECWEFWVFYLFGLWKPGPSFWSKEVTGCGSQGGSIFFPRTSASCPFRMLPTQLQIIRNLTPPSPRTVLVYLPWLFTSPWSVPLWQVLECTSR